MDNKEPGRDALAMAADYLRHVPQECRAAYLAALAGLLESAAVTGSISGAAWREYARAAAAVRLAGAGDAMHKAFIAVGMAAFDTFREEQTRPAGPAQVIEMRPFMGK